MRLFVGLGNPGAKYAHNRHNIGFMAVEEIARRHGFAPWRRGSHGELLRGMLGREQIAILLPSIFMNDSGLAVQEAASFLKITQGEIAIFHDELQLPSAKVRVRIGGGLAGHNGLRSISSHIGNDYGRVRLGIGRPVTKDLVHSYVLSNFAQFEEPWLVSLFDVISNSAALLADDLLPVFEENVNQAMQARGFFNKDAGGTRRP
jgi:peptidyl-tRNA hydrolase, PTH1 family